MRVMCEGCETNFNVDDRLIKASGSKVRCSKCRHVFVAYPPLAAAEAAEPPMAAGWPAGVDALQQFPEQQEIDSNIDALFGEEVPADAGAPADQEPEFLDVDDLLAGETPAAEALTTETLGDDLRLDLDLGLSLEGDRTEDAAAGPAGLDASRSPGGKEAEIDINLDLEPADGPADVEELPSLEELELNLDDLDKMDQAADVAAAGAAAEGPAADEIELDLDLESLAVEADQKRPAAVEEPDLEDLLAEAASDAGQAEDVSLAPAPAAVEPPPAAAEGLAAAGGEALGDELDLSDLEAMLEGEGPAEDKQPAGEDADLVLDLGGEAAAEGPPADQMEELDLSDFAGDLEEAEDAAAQAPAAELEPAAGAAPGAAPAAAEADELDFTDIAGILDKETPAPAAPEDAAPTEDLDLLFDESPAAAGPPPAAAEAEEDLTLDLEALLEDSAEKAEEAARPPAEAAAELDFDFIEESAPPAAGDDMEIEIEAVGEDEEADAVVAATAAAASAGAAALQGETEAVTDDFSTEEFTDAGLPGATDILETEAAEEAPAAEKKTAPRRRSGVGRLVLTVLAVLVLAVAALVVPRSLGIHIPYLSDLEIPYLSELDIEIPFIGKIFQPEPEDVAGNLKIAPLAPSVTAEFVDNEKAGRLCVVKGQVQNSYDHPRSFIRVTGKLYTRDNKMARALTGYAGNLLSNQELAALDPAAITARMNVKNGLRNSNVGVKPGATVPFMLVFSNLPENLDEYSVEVAGSNK